MSITIYVCTVCVYIHIHVYLRTLRVQNLMSIDELTWPYYMHRFPSKIQEIYQGSRTYYGCMDLLILKLRVVQGNMVPRHARTLEHVHARIDALSAITSVNLLSCCGSKVPPDLWSSG